MISNNILDLFSVAVQQFGNNIAIACSDQTISYSDLECKADNVANALIAAGAAGSPVGIMAENSVEVIASIIGILKSGNAFVPFDPNIPGKRIEAMLAETLPQYYLADPKFYGKLRETTDRLGIEAKVITTESVGSRFDARCNSELIGSSGACIAGSRSCVGLGPDDLCYVYFTSGSTGRPKAIAGRYKGISHFICWEIEALGLSSETRVSRFLNFTFDGSLRDIFAPLCVGGTVCVPGSLDTMLDARKLIEWLNLNQINLIHCVPSLLRSIINEQPDPSNFPHLRHVLLAGEPLLPSDVKKWISIFGERVQLVNLYGTSETTMAKFVYFVKAADAERQTIPIGKPMPGARGAILDEKRRVCPPGVIGEIYIRTPYRSLGYFNRPDLTQEVFVQNPLSPDPQDIIYKTGDLGRILEDGNFEFLGRKDRQVKVRGGRVELSEIESHLISHQDVEEAAVVDYKDPSHNSYLCAYIVTNKELNPTELREHSATHLPDFMIPSVFVRMDKLPKTISGKVDRRSLPRPAREQIDKNVRYVAPRTPVEETLAGIWTMACGLTRIGINDNFFHLGGHSLMATQIISRIRSVFQVELPLQSLFEAPTIAGIAKKVEQALKGEQVLFAQPIGQVAGSTDSPLSFAQQRLWFMEQLKPGNAAYNINVALKLNGPLNVIVLEQALNEVSRRQESLRTAFLVAGGKPTQFISPLRRFSLPLIDLSRLIESQVEIELKHLMAVGARRPFDLSLVPLWRGILLRTDENEVVLLFTMHHIISDGWSFGVLVEEMARLYEEYLHGVRPSLPELTIQYTDFTYWQRQWFGTEFLNPQVEYWKRQLADSPPALALLPDKPRPPISTFRGASEFFLLPRELSRAVRETSSREGVTMFMFLLAAFYTLLYRYSGQDDLAIGTAIANRTRQEIEGLIGFFANTLVIRTRFSGRLNVRELLAQVRKVALEAYANQDLPFEKLVETLQLERDLSLTPLFQAAFAYQHEPREVLSLPGLAITLLKIDNGAAKYDLHLSLTESGEILSGTMEYNTDLFDRATITRMIGHYKRLIESLVSDLDRPLSDLSMLAEDESRQILAQWNNTYTPLRRDRYWHHILEERAVEGADAVALVFDEQHLTYRELNRRANQLAHRLRRMGVGPEIRVGICLDRSLEVVTALFGVLKAGGAFVPLDPSYPAERMGYMLAKAQVSALLTQEKLLERIPHRADSSVCFDTEQNSIERENDTNPDWLLLPENLAYVIFTSGSTGTPKGVMIEHKGIANLGMSMQRACGLSEESRILQFASFSFDASVYEIVTAVQSGAPLHLGSKESLMPGPNLLTSLRDQAITSVLLPPSVLSIMLDSELPALSQLIVGGEACPKEVVSTWSRGRRFFNAYGPTETTVIATIAECFGNHEIPAIGSPIDNARAYLMDDNWASVPISVPGELYIDGIGLARGYVDCADLTAERFIPNPFSQHQGEVGRRLYKTGDWARYHPDGNLVYLRRLDGQVKLRGFRIEMGEIESALNRHPGVRDAVVILQGEGAERQRLVAYITPAFLASVGVFNGEGHGSQHHQEPPFDRSWQVTTESLKSHLKLSLPDYMVPADFIFIEELPRMPNGKVDRRALLRIDGVRATPKKEFIAPHTEIERQIAALWKEVLGLDAVGIDDNFFDLGGHSLLVVRLHARLTEMFDKKISITDMFQYPTIDSLVRYLNHSLKAPEGDRLSLILGDRVAEGRKRMQQLLRLSKLEVENTVRGHNEP